MSLGMMRGSQQGQDSVSVIIPFYQRSPGILTNTLRSVFAQTAPVELRVIVVDDESPVSAEQECAALSPTDRVSIQIIRQRNAGAAAARNRGLEAVKPDCRYIALLDSDDVWMDYHLDYAMESLHQGYDFFFSNHQRTSSDLDQFKIAHFIPSMHPIIDAQRGLHALDGNLFETVLQHSPVGTSTVVFNRERFKHIRFPESFRLCEDLLCWLDIARTGCRVAFGEKTQVLYMEGINLFGRADWTSPESLKNAIDFATYYAEIRRRYPLTDDQKRKILQKRLRSRRDFAASVMYLLRHHRYFDLRTVWRFLLLEPRFAIDAVVFCTSAISKRLASGKK